MATALASVVPAPPADADTQWMYVLQSPHELPVLDLSLSLKSRFLSRRALSFVNRVIGFRRATKASAIVANVLFLMVLVAPMHVGRVAGPLVLLFWIPVSLSSLCSLRYDVVVLLVQTYDFWFSTCLNLAVFAVFGVMLGGSRGVAVGATVLGIEANFLVDANIRRVRSWLLFSVIATVLYCFAWAAISLAIIDDMHTFSLIHYRHHELSAASFVTSGLFTVIANLGRNVYRRRGIISNGSYKTVIECVMYLSDLQMYTTASVPKQRSQWLGAHSPEYLKPMMCVKQLGEIDARDTVLRRPALLKLSACWRHFTRFGGAKTLAWLGRLPLLLFAGSVTFNLKPSQTHSPLEQALHFAGFGLSVVYCGVCALHYQRTLLMALVMSFDFFFLSLQVTSIHVCACMFFGWTPDNSMAVATSWIWAHWFMCLDALPPVTKRKLGVTRRFAVAALLVLGVASLMLLHLIVFTEVGSVEAYNRVVWEGSLSRGYSIQIKLMSVFFNCLATTVVLFVRLLWRALFLDHDVLLVLNGAVVYENYLLTARVRASRRLGSGRGEPAAGVAPKGRQLGCETPDVVVESS